MPVLKNGQTSTICGLGSWTHTAASTAMYTATVKTTNNASSSVSIVIAQTGSTSVSVTSTAPVASQTHEDLQKTFNCVAGDVITITVSSAAATDNQLNEVKSTVKVNLGMN